MIACSKWAFLGPYFQGIMMLQVFKDPFWESILEPIGKMPF
jgi:hypothetical protein